LAMSSAWQVGNEHPMIWLVAGCAGYVGQAEP